MKKRIRIQGLLIFISFLLAIFLYKILLAQWQGKLLDKLFNCLGIALVLSGFLFRISARGYKEEKSSQGRNLVTDGPYAAVRNPMYFGTLLIGTGVIFTLLQLWVIFPFIVIFLLIYISQIKKEEALLLKTFKKEYEAYSQSTPRCFPRLKDLLSLRGRLRLKLSWVKKESASLLLTIIAILAIEVWEDVQLFGRPEFLKESMELVLMLLSFAALIVLFSNKNQIKS